MSERPILFSGPMMRAILDGVKTQTRRVVKLYAGNHADKAGCVRCDEKEGWMQYGAGGVWMKFPRCPYGVSGDRLWVRETFCIESSRSVGYYPPPFSDGRPIRYHDDEEDGPWWEQPHYAASDPAPELDIGTDDPGCRWRPSIHMQRWASRITLEVTGVRVERVQDISEADARAEGMPGWCSCCAAAGIEPCAHPENCQPNLKNFAGVWDSINAKRGFGWDANPWVWVVGFKRVLPNAAQTDLQVSENRHVVD